MIKKLLLPVFLFSIQHCFSQALFQLAPPILKYKSGFFSGSTSFEVVFNQPGAEVRYTLNGKEPTDKDPVYSTAVPVTKRTTVRAKAFGKDFLPSETVTASFIKDGKAIRQIHYSKPNESYVKSKPDILQDNIGGITNYRSGTWIGYDNDTATITIDLAKKESVNSILINLLQDENSWIFLPEQVLVYYYNDQQKTYLQFGKKEFQHTSQGPKQCYVQEISPDQKIKTDKLKLVLLPLKKIPDWHNGKGNHGWLFIDEIKVY
jgi:Chitobiase/beta-hexosaminidase C-terminal domain